MVAQVRAEGTANHPHWQAQHCSAQAGTLHSCCDIISSFLCEMCHPLDPAVCGCVCPSGSNLQQPAVSIYRSYIIVQGVGVQLYGYWHALQIWNPLQRHCIAPLLHCSDLWSLWPLTPSPAFSIDDRPSCWGKSVHIVVVLKNFPPLETYADLVLVYVIL